jgi:hypothetical protein
MRRRDQEAQRKREFEELTTPLPGPLYRFAAQNWAIARPHGRQKLPLRPPTALPEVRACLRPRLRRNQDLSGNDAASTGSG